jgi:hypothetical protein
MVLYGVVTNSAGLRSTTTAYPWVTRRWGSLVAGRGFGQDGMLKGSDAAASPSVVVGGSAWKLAGGGRVGTTRGCRTAVETLAQQCSGGIIGRNLGLAGPDLGLAGLDMGLIGIAAMSEQRPPWVVEGGASHLSCNMVDGCRLRCWLTLSNSPALRYVDCRVFSSSSWMHILLPFLGSRWLLTSTTLTLKKSSNQCFISVLVNPDSTLKVYSFFPNKRRLFL